MKFPAQPGIETVLLLILNASYSSKQDIRAACAAANEYEIIAARRIEFSRETLTFTFIDFRKPDETGAAEISPAPTMGGHGATVGAIDNG